MKKNNNYLVLALILLFSIFSNVAISEETAEVGINVKWDVSDQSALSDFSTPTMNFLCGGENFNYGGDGYDQNKHIYTIYVNGPFPGWDRDAAGCKIGSNEVYFSTNKLVISFSYNGQPNTCTITQEVGTSYDHRYNQYDKLQSSDSGNWWACDSKNVYEYKITAGQDDPLFFGLNPGNIEIKPLN